ncbi:porin family protein [uncultured Draconibacterium sp.]|uniref:porin family protein n=1 Tax=uncultured Draconibacterium sp. TaxID=1573823 RepID=UPI0029C77553|nr:porin family protein [uncultured Draconibacterium sp.]
MKRFLFASLFVLIASVGFSQPVFDLGVKAGVHYSNMSLDGEPDLSSDAITKMHWGAFGRVGFNRVYVQPEVYFSKKGGDLSFSGLSGGFDYKNIDVPVLLGYKLVKTPMIDFRVMAGPVFSFVTDADYPEGWNDLNDEFLNDNLFGVQYGLGVDVLFFTLDARMEHSGIVYDDPDFVNGKSTSFLLTLGFKIL